MPDLTELALAALMLIAAALYASVGHAGASAYIALMALFGTAPDVMRPTALVLNIIVATLGSIRYVRAGLIRWRALWPFLVTAIPMAFVGGSIELPPEIYRPLVGVVLILAALRLLLPNAVPAVAPEQWRDPPLKIALAAGAGIGLLAGLTGTGGGIFLSPLLLFAGWCHPKPALGVASLFVLANSVSGLLGNISAIGSLPPELPLYAGAVLIGGIAGTAIGIRVSAPIILKLLAVVLLIAGAKLIGIY